jgi:hypothetical protein
VINPVPRRATHVRQPAAMVENVLAANFPDSALSD